MHSKRLVCYLTLEWRQLVPGALPVSGAVEASAQLAVALAVLASDIAAAEFDVEAVGVALQWWCKTDAFSDLVFIA